MKVRVERSHLSGKICAPPSKSFAHRYLIAAALSNQKSRVCGISKSEDMLATLDCLSSLGVSYNICESAVEFDGINKTQSTDYPCRESGSTLRFMIPTVLALGQGKATFSGSDRLISRGISVYEELLSQSGIKFDIGKTEITATGRLKSGKYSLRGDISSQFVTGMLFALPLLDGDSTLEVLPPIESRSYIDITLEVLRSFGIVIEENEPNIFKIVGGQKYNGGTYTVEGDYSNAAFLYAANELGADLEICGLSETSIQGDRVCKEYFAKINDGYANIDLSDCPDLAPILFTVAACKSGARFTGTKRLEIKESNRAEAMRAELSKFGADIKVYENEVVISKTKLHAPSEALCSHNDHRIVMSLAVLAGVYGAHIDGCEAVNKSYPDFFDEMKVHGLIFEVEDET